jgi:pyridoxal phosphate enzyme (YggS family)
VNADVAMTDRRAEIAANLERVRARVAAACERAGRTADDVTVVAVTKTFPASDVEHLHALGLRDVGENRDQDAAAKVAACREAGLHDLVWHFVGQVQRNKAASIASYADVVHSVDRTRLVAALDRGAQQAGRRVDCLVQVDLREPPADDGRGGAAPDDVLAIADLLADAEGLRPAGVMAIAPLGLDDAATERAFWRLVALAARLRAEHPDATVVSAGMSGDLEAAVGAGATHLRLGTALLGSRPVSR